MIGHTGEPPGRVVGVGAVTGGRITNSSDNPAWSDTTTGSTTTTTRFGDSISGDLGASISADGSASLPLATLHGDVVTTVGITATQDTATPAAGCSGWSDYTEYGAPRDPTATASVGGDRGYGWLGAKQRSTTTTFSARLTLMGDRLYNPATGRFTATDPVAGGNDNAYTYPGDPINGYDLNGQWCVGGVGTTCTRWVRDEYGRRVRIGPRGRAKAKGHNVGLRLIKDALKHAYSVIPEGGGSTVYLYHARQGTCTLNAAGLQCRPTGKVITVRVVVNFRKMGNGQQKGLVTAYCVGQRCPRWVNRG